jgi:hypothetical protein
MHEDSLKNATNLSDPDPVFFLNPAQNPNPRFEWTGVRSAPGGRVDNRAFLQDINGNFPLFGQVGPAGDEDQFYAPRTAINLRGGSPVDPVRFPYAALSNRLREEGGVNLGDFGLAIRPSARKSSPFVYADAGGPISNSLGECSTKLIENLGVRDPAREEICYIVFPGSRPTPGVAEPELMEETVRRRLQSLSIYANPHHIAWYLAHPDRWDPGTGLQRAAFHAFADRRRIVFDAQFDAILHELAIRGTWRQDYKALPDVKLNKQIF